MISFYELWEQISKEDGSPLMDSGLETKAVQAARAGENIRGEGNSSFWKDFIQLCANSDGLAELLGVRREQVNTWPKKIQAALNDLKQHNKTPDSDNKQKNKIIPTGETGAVTTSNMGPYGKKGK